MIEIFAVVALLALLLAAWPVGVLSEARGRPATHLPDPRALPLAASVTLFKGGWAGRDPAGNLKPFEPGDVLAGLTWATVVNAGGAGAASAQLVTEGDVTHTLTGVAVTDVGRAVYAVADDALAFSGHPDAYAGRVKKYLAVDSALIRLKQAGERPLPGQGSIEINIDFARQGFAALDEATPTAVILGGLLKTACVGAGLTAPTTGLLLDEANGEARLPLDATSEPQNLTFETPQTFNVTKGVTFELEGRLKTAGGAATDDVDFGLMGLAGGITAAERANMNAATAGLLAVLFHLDADANDVFGTSDDNAAPVGPTDTTFNNSLTVNHVFKIIVRPGGAAQLWIDGVRKLAATAFTVGAAGLLAGIVNLEKSTGTGVPEVRVRRLRVAGALA